MREGNGTYFTCLLRIENEPFYDSILQFFFVDLSFRYPYESPYKFNGKEKDEETGYNNYEARYYGSDIGIFLSVDPLSDKYPHLSPYVYCANNPVKYIDPDGREIWIASIGGTKVQYKSDGELYDEEGRIYTGDDTYARTIQGQLNELKEMDNSMYVAITVLEFVDIKHTIRMPEKDEETMVYPISGGSRKAGIFLRKNHLSTGTVMVYNPNKKKTSKGTLKSSLPILAHELWHCYEYNNGEIDFTRINGIKKSEINAIMKENYIRIQTGDPMRIEYNNIAIPDIYLKGIQNKPKPSPEKSKNINRNTRYF